MLSVRVILVLAVIVGLAVSTGYYVFEYIDASSRLSGLEDSVRQKAQIEILNFGRMLDSILPDIRGLDLDYEGVYCSGNASLINSTILRLDTAGKEFMLIHQMVIDAQLSIGVLLGEEPGDRVYSKAHDILDKYAEILMALMLSTTEIKLELQSALKRGVTPGNCSQTMSPGLTESVQRIQAMTRNLDMLRNTISELDALRLAVANHEYSPQLDKLDNDLKAYIQAAGIRVNPP